MERPLECALCQRQTLLSFHHLVPRKLHRRRRFRKSYSKAELHQGVYLCRRCHRGLHRLYDEMTLGTELNTLAKLLADEKIIKHVRWVKKQKERKG